MGCLSLDNPKSERVIMKRNYKNYHLSTKLISLIFTFGLIFMCSSAYCEEDCQKDKPTEDKWQFRVTPYAVFDSMDLDATVSGITVPVDLDFPDLWDNFDIISFEFLAEARKGNSNWSLFLEVNYTDLDGDFNHPDPVVDRVNVDLVETKVDLAVMYRLFKRVPMKSEGCYLPLSLDVWGGARYNYLKDEISIRTSDGLSTTLGKSKDWVEPLVGARIKFCLTKKLTLGTAGDVSGFGVGSASDRTWSFTVGFDYQLFKRASLNMGYYIYDIKYSNGSGTEKFGLDGKIEGPFVGMTFLF
jgi:hypothetical protein